MSTIMRALRRLEQERERQVETDRLHGEVVAPSSARGPAPRLSPGLAKGLGLAVVLLASGAGAAWWWLGMSQPAGEPRATAPAEVVAPMARADDSQAPSRVPAVAPAVPRDSRPVPVPAPQRPSVAAAAPPQARSPGVSRVRGLEPPAPPPEASEPRAPRTAASAPPAPPPEPQITRERKVTSLPEVPAIDPQPARPTRTTAPPSVKPTAQTGAQTMARAPAPSSARTAPPERASEPAAKPTPEAEPKPKPRSQPQPKPEASPEVVAPSFSVVRTVWHPKPERRVAQLSSADGSKVEVREGEAYEGLVVEEIQLSSVVFREGDVTFSRRVSARR